MRTRVQRAEGRPEKDRLIAAVKAAREERGMSQRALSKALGLYPMSIMSFERGERELSVIELIDIARALGLKPVELLQAAAEDRPLD